MNSQTHHFIKHIALGCGAALALTACYQTDPKDSDEVSTNQTYVHFSVTGRASGPIDAHVQLREGGAAGAPLRLIDGDSLWFSSGQSVNDYETGDNIARQLAEASQRVMRMESHGIIDFDFLFLHFAIEAAPYYTASLDPVAENRYYLGYLRAQQADATGSYVSLPDVFNITTPAGNESVNRANDIVVNWQSGDDPDVDEVEIHAALVCGGNTVNSFREVLDTDAGTYTIPGGTLDYRIDQRCPLSIEVSKQRRGTLGRYLNGGEITGQRVDTVTVSSTE